MKNKFRQIPSVDSLLFNPQVKELISKYNRDLVVYAIREAQNELRNAILNENRSLHKSEIVQKIDRKVKLIAESSLKAVINATGIILHTNLGRAPLGNEIIENMAEVVNGYCNLEFDLGKGRRGKRNIHIRELLKFITGAEDAIVVNNNAAAVLLCLKTFAGGKEGIISRSELIEIGGSFRIPDIMKTSGVKMVEVGTTNKTKIKDFEAAITKDTKILFKAHKSNFVIRGFTEEVSLKELVALGKKYSLMVFYDIGSGLLQKTANIDLENEPDIKSALNTGIDLISFSCDKLLGGPQAGVIAGKRKFVRKLAKQPLMRTLRVGKLSLSALEITLRNYLKNDILIKNKLSKYLSRKKSDLEELANYFLENLNEAKIPAEIINHNAKVGGGTLPDFKIKSRAIKLRENEISKEINSEIIYKELLKADKPIVSILVKGDILFDVLTLEKSEIIQITKSLTHILK